MKRGGPLERRTALQPGSKPLQQHAPLQRRSRLQQTAGPERASAIARSGIVPPQRPSKAKPERGSADREPAKRPLPRNTGPNRATRRLAHKRDGGLCVRCGAPATNLQHRVGRGMGGRGKDEAAETNGVEWLISVCGNGNTSGCHRWCDEERGEAVSMGYVILRNGQAVNAEDVPVLTMDGWQVFTEDGRRVPWPQPGT